MKHSAAHEAAHTAVMRDAAVAQLNIHAAGIYVDGTFGRGGYSRAILAHQPQHLFAFDRDPSAIEAGQNLAAEFPNLTLVPERFGAMLDALQQRRVTHIDGIVFDLGVSSPQLDEAERGFSFRADGPLDMRMDPAISQSAADLVNELAETALADLIYTYGDERFSRRIARAIVAARAVQPITRTLVLADIVRRVVPRSKDGIDPATRTFQALRIAVNDELGELAQGLAAAEILLKPAGRLVVVSFHALEDRIVKEFVRARNGKGSGTTRHAPIMVAAPATFNEITRKAIAPDAAEITANPRARSARMRVAERIAAFNPHTSTVLPPTVLPPTVLQGDLS